MNDEIINRVIYGLLALSTILAVVLGASVFIQGPGIFVLEFLAGLFQPIGADRPMMATDGC